MLAPLARILERVHDLGMRLCDALAWRRSVDAAGPVADAWHGHLVREMSSKIRRDERGRYLPGCSGNPSGRPRLVLTVADDGEAAVIRHLRSQLGSAERRIRELEARNVELQRHIDNSRWLRCGPVGTYGM